MSVAKEYRVSVYKNALISVLALSFIFGYSTVAAGDIEKGKQKAATCMGCHGVPSYTSVYPTYPVPKLGGQHEEYLIASLKAYKSGERQHRTMQGQATRLSDEDIADVAAYLASLKN